MVCTSHHRLTTNTLFSLGFLSPGLSLTPYCPKPCTECTMVVPMSATLIVLLEKEQEMCIYSCNHYAHVILDILKSKHAENLMKI